MHRKAWAALAATLAALCLIPVWRAVFLGEAIGPYDQFAVPVRATTDAWNVLEADGALQFYPWRDLVFESWRKGRLPAWNPYALGGTPLLANSQSGALYPPHVLLGVLGVPTPLAVGLLAWLHLVVAGLGCALLALRLGANAWGAASAGVGLALGSFLLAWLPLASVPTTCAWIPWAMALALGAGGRARVPLLAIATALMLLGGHLQFAAYGLGASILLLAWSAREHGAWQGVGGGLLALVLGVGLALPQVLPVLEYSKQSHRRGAASADGYEAYRRTALQPLDVVARAVGSRSQGDPNTRILGDSTLGGFLPALQRPGVAFAETAVTIGPALLLGLFALLLRRELPAVAPALIVAALGLLVAFGTPLTRLLYFAVPGWSSTGSPGRAAILAVIALCAAGGVGLGRCIVERDRGTRWPLVAVLVAAALGPCVGIALAPAPPGVGPEFWAAFTAQTPIALLYALVASALAALGLWLRSDAARFAAFVAATWVAVWPHVPTGEPSAALPPDIAPGASERVAFVNAAWSLFERPPALVPPNLSSLRRVRDLSGYDSLVSAETVRMLREVNARDPAPAANGNIMFVWPSVQHEALASAGVTWLYAQADAEGLIVRTRIEGPGRIQAPVGVARVERDEPGEIVLTADGPGTLIVRERRLSGWSARVGGARRALATSVPNWLALELPAGMHRVELRFAPPGLTTGVQVAGLCLVFLLGSLVWVARRKPRQK